MLKHTLFLRAAWVLVACAACRPQSSEPAAPTLSEVQVALSERDRRLGGFDVAGTIVEGTHEGTFSFSFRPPNKVRGSITRPSRQSLAFDGKTFFQRNDERGQLYTTDLSGLDAAAISGQLHTVFGAFVVEGFRAPILPQKTQVTMESREEGTVVVLTANARSPQGTAKVTTYHRWPSLDFLEKRVETPGLKATGVRMEEERCEASLSLCVPSRWVHLVDGRVSATVTLDTIRLGGELSPQTFTLEAEDGTAAARDAAEPSGEVATETGALQDAVPTPSEAGER